MGEIKFSLRVQILEWSQNTHAAVTRVSTKTSKRESPCCIMLRIKKRAATPERNGVGRA